LVQASDLLTHGKNSKVKRPRNAFIIYRQKYHPIIKAQRPNIHNNDISQILGKQWRDEPESVKNEYRALAEEFKRKHAAENPGYQYAPRKPSEKKRRMTAKKMARLRTAQAEEETQSFPAIDMLEVADHERSETEGLIDSEDDVARAMPMHTRRAAQGASDYLRTDRPASTNHMQQSTPGRVALTLPMQSRQLDSELDNYAAGFRPSQMLSFNPSTREQIETSASEHVINDQDFFDSLIDWEGIREDMEIVHGSTMSEEEEFEMIESGNPYLTLVADGKRAEFEAELQRTLSMFD